MGAVTRYIYPIGMDPIRPEKNQKKIAPFGQPHFIILKNQNIIKVIII